MEEKFREGKDEIDPEEENTNYLKHKNSNCEENKWLRFANDLGATDKDNFFSSYEELVNEVIEKIHDDTDSSYNLNSDFDNDSENYTHFKDKKTSTHRKTFQHKKRKDTKTQNAIKSIGAKYQNKIEKFRKKQSSIGLFCESMATTISNAKLPIEQIFQIQKDVLKVVTSRIGEFKKN